MFEKLMLWIAGSVFATMVIFCIYVVATMPPKPGSYLDRNVTTVETLDGTWSSKAKDGISFKALVRYGNIEVNLVTDNNIALYWAGTFYLSAEDDQIVSVADKAKLEGSLLGSTSDTKIFTYDGDKLSFTFGAMGVSTKIEMEKN